MHGQPPSAAPFATASDSATPRGRRGCCPNIAEPADPRGLCAATGVRTAERHVLAHGLDHHRVVTAGSLQATCTLSGKMASSRPTTAGQLLMKINPKGCLLPRTRGSVLKMARSCGGDSGGN